jgi:hypothetical protein
MSVRRMLGLGCILWLTGVTGLHCWLSARDSHDFRVGFLPVT